ncbi:hypothetical protein F7731_16745 [Cytobacillus depressus]|uniref:Sporulation protein n=1 Tax=Cytobacillus depressus TaxID=1602942 RepID=A0A6L3V4Z0_9BACI|nr:hypothetical protein F7731_16745 [Cytobacillus depressus]
MKKLFVFILILGLTAGCANFNRGVENFTGTNGNDTGLRNISTDERDYNTRDWTMDSQNPNFLNLDGRNKVNNQADIDHARQVIDATGEYRSGPVWINGDDMWVTAYKKEMMTDRQRATASSKLRKKLIEALPRYHIEVKIQEDRT